MSVELTKSAKKSLAILYKEYCQRVNNGERKSRAITFENYSENVADSRAELKRAGFICVDILGSIQLTDKAIIYMENEKIETIKEWLSFGAQFIP